MIKLLSGSIRIAIFYVLLPAALFAAFHSLQAREPKRDESTAYRDLIAEADALYVQREDLAKAQKAWQTYQQAIKKNPDGYETLWKAAKTGFALCEVIKSNKERKPIVMKAVEYARQAVKVNPEGVDGHFWLGVNYTKEGEVRGVFKALSRIGPAKKEMRKVISLDKTYEGGGALTWYWAAFIRRCRDCLGGRTRKRERISRLPKVFVRPTV